MVKCFVYGILVGGFNGVPAVLYDYERFVRGHASVRFRGDYPDEYLTVGELLDVDEFQLARFDVIEGVEVGYYHRFKVQVEDYEGKIHDDVWVYQQVEDQEDSTCVAVEDKEDGA